MKNKFLIFSISFLFSVCILNAQETPKPILPSAPTPPTPPVTLPATPETPKSLGVIVPSEAQMPSHKSDTTIISIGDKQIIIIDNGEKKLGNKAEWEEELEENMQEMKENLEEAKMELEESKADIDKSKKDIEKSEKEMEHELQKEEEENHENQAPDDKHKLKFKLKKGDKGNKATSFDFLDFDFGVNFLRFGNSIPKQMEDDLRLKTWGSWSYTFTFLPTKIYLGTRNLMLMTGLGWRIGFLEFKEKIDFEPNKTLVYAKADNLKRSQFVIHQLQIPLSIYWKSKRIKGLGDLGFGVGTYAGILISQELETETDNPDRDIETNEDFGFNDFRYGISARLDIGALKLFANFDMNKLWKDNDIKNAECGIWIDF